jgi:hypothetical protein
MKEEAREGWRATNATNGKVVACSFTPSFTFMDITTPNDKLVLMKKFNESRVRQSMSLEVWNIIVLVAHQDDTTNAYLRLAQS